MANEAPKEDLEAPERHAGGAGPLVRKRLDNPWGSGAARQALIAVARREWPKAWVPTDAFLEFVAERLADDEGPQAALDRLAIADLYLACACARGVESAVRTFAERCSPVVGAAVRQAARGVHVGDDIQQMVFEKVFLPRPGAAPRITRYSGRGSLKNWIRVVAVRTTQDHLRRHRHEDLEPEPDTSFAPVVALDPELALFKEKHRKDFDECFRLAVTELGERDRNILRYHVVDGLELQAIAQLYQVHRVTVSRWVGRIREQVRARTRQGLARRLGASDDEMSSIMRAVQSRLGGSVSEYLVE